ncbi:MAG: hypothetical protein ACXACX_05690 [Candidatus Hodarchaeales archaeon]|jgi:hypothetical protein
MSTNQFLVISIKDSSLIKEFIMKNCNNLEIPGKTMSMTIDIGESIKSSFFDKDVFVIESTNVDIRIDLNLASIKNAVKKFENISKV